MSIATEIERIQGDIEDCYTACAAHGATLPVNRNSANLASCVETCEWGFPYEITEQGVLQRISKPYKFRFPPSATSFGFNGSAFTNTFVNDTNLVEIDFGNLSKILRCQGCTSLVTAKANGVTESNLGGTLLSAFNGCTSLKNVELNGLTITKVTASSNGGLQRAFLNCTSLESMNFPALTTIYNRSGPGQPFMYAFQGCTALKTVYFPVVETVSGYCFQDMLNGCSNVNIYFNSLKSAVQVLSGGYYPFYKIFNGATNCAIHFPSNKSFNTSDVSGTNCQVLYDLPAV